MNGLEYQQVYAEESFGTHGGFGLKIMMATTKPVEMETDLIRDGLYSVAKIIKSAVMLTVIENDPESHKQTSANCKILLAFPDKIFVEEVPNGYCSDYCCKHLPWFVVTTVVGRFRIGRRKRVIQIEWDETVKTKSAPDLFKDEDVTKGEKMIHAWSVNDAKRYIEAIIASAAEQPEPTHTIN